MKSLIRLLIVSVAMPMVLLLAGCDDDVPAAEMSLYDIVTFEGYTDDRPVFTMRKSEDSPLLTLTGIAADTISSSVKTGYRVILQYQPLNGEAYTSGDVKVERVVRINYDKLRKGPLTGWDADPIYLLSMWRTGEYINMQCYVKYSDSKRRLYLLLDETTAADEVPQLYLMHDMLDAPDNFSRRIYASWDIAALWNLDSCRGVTVHLNDSNRDIDQITFMK